ncbi:MAG: GAF domain-containing protein [Rhodoferax sp.]|nr:GAF domain-containing protein [Rhodoferax sp.]
MKHKNELPASGQHRLLSLYSALIACDHAVIRSSNPSDLFDEVCRNIVHLGQMSVAWIGMVDAGDQRIWPQAHCGEDDNYLEWIKLSVNVDQMPGQGPAGTAILEDRPIWSHDLQHDEDMAAMRDLARAQGWHSTAVIPLTMGGVASGALSIYTKTVHAFGEKEQQLLAQLASNISYALNYFELDAQRKQAEFALLESEVRYSALFSSNCMPMLVIDPADGRVVDANIRAIDFYGWDHATFTSMHEMDFNVMSPAEIRLEMAQAVAAKRSYFDLQHRLSSGEIRNVEVFSSPISFGGQTYLITAIHDITERRRLELKVRNAQSLTQRFIDHLPGTAFVKDSQLRLLMVNEHLGRVLGRPPQSLIGKTAQDIFPPDFAQVVSDLDRKMLEQGGSSTFEETFNGRHNETSMFVIDEANGQRLLGGVSFDVTDRYRASERANAQLRINELGSQLSEKQLLEDCLTLVVDLTRSTTGCILYVSEDESSLEPMAGIAGVQQGGAHAVNSPRLAPHFLPWSLCLDARAPLVRNVPGTDSESVTMQATRGDLTRWIAVPIIESGRVRLILGVANKCLDYDDFDVDALLLCGNDLWRIVRRAHAETALKQRVDELVVVNQKLSQTQLQLLQSEKMASIGQLASGVAHEINNPIGFVKSNLGSLASYVNGLVEIVRTYEEVERRLGEPMAKEFHTIRERKAALDYDYLIGDLSQLIEESREGVQRISKIVLDLKNFSRSGDGEKQWADIHEGIESTINVVWNQLKYKAEVVRAYGNLPPVYCIASQINQVVMNLLINAGQAIAEHGHIHVRTGTEGEHIWIEVQDDGCGIEPMQMDRIFEPFYTSKPVGQGTGLGLSITFGIVQRHQGHITVQSTPKQGTTFRVVLPIEAKSQPPDAPAQAIRETQA